MECCLQDLFNIYIYIYMIIKVERNRGVSRTKNERRIEGIDIYVANVTDVTVTISSGS